MNQKPTEYTVTLTVGDGDLAQAVGSGDLPVFATPRMAALMEQAAAQLAAAYLDEGVTTVGVALNIAHTAPTLTGAVVSATAKLIETDGRRFAFEVSARDQAGEIGSGTHDRVSVKSARFLEKAAMRGQDK